MTKTALVTTGLAALALSIGACNIHDNTITANIPNASLDVTTTADVDNVMPAQTIPMTVAVQNVYLVDPSATPPPEHVEDAGHLEFHLDDEDTPPLLVTAQTNVSVTVPPTTPPGHHKIICRVHKHDGEATNTKFEVDINVKASVTVSGTGGTTGSAGTTGAAGSTTGAGGESGSSGAAGAPADGGVTVSVDASVVVSQ